MNDTHASDGCVTWFIRYNCNSSSVPFLWSTPDCQVSTPRASRCTQIAGAVCPGGHANFMFTKKIPAGGGVTSATLTVAPTAGSAMRERVLNVPTTLSNLGVAYPPEQLCS